jgi:hypothetical protein
LVHKWSTLFKKGATELSVWIEEDVKKAFFSTEYILVHKWSTRFKKGAIELSVWIEEDVKKAFFSTEYILVHKWSTRFYRPYDFKNMYCSTFFGTGQHMPTVVDQNIFCSKESFFHILFYPN